jgi:predicted AlkP superfamily pyrophosphatase or phosphodiesterase
VNKSNEKKRLFVLSVDSLFYEDIPWIRECPHLMDIFSQGSRIKGMRSTYPTMTYVAHTTILTGCHPDRHGIFHNEKVQVGNKHPDWHWFRGEIRRPTLFDEAKKAGLGTAAVNWPVTGADPAIDYLIPEIWAEEFDGDPRPRFEKACSPGMMDLFNKYHRVLRWKEQPELDIFGLSCTLDIIREYRPELILLHLSYLDSARHKNGVFAEKAKEALAACDERFGHIVRALEEAGVREKTNFVVIGDHGHRPVRQVFNPNIRLVKEGLIRLGHDGTVASWDAYCHSAGLSCQVTLADPADGKIRQRLLRVMESMVSDESLGCEQILCREELKSRYHLEGPIDYCIEGREGTAFGNNCTGEEILSACNRDYKLSVSSHGHMPEKGPQPILFAAGPGIRDGVELPAGDLIDEGPTFAKILGLEMPSAQGRAISGLFRSF